jgi:hypothetical protein
MVLAMKKVGELEIEKRLGFKIVGVTFYLLF